jgi:hypothetical protein
MKNPGRRMDLYEEQLNIWLLAVGIVSKDCNMLLTNIKHTLIFKPLCDLVMHI